MIRDVLAIDGEGYSPEGTGGPHWYTLLNVYDSWRGGHWAIRNWSESGGLSTTQVVRFLVSLLARRQSIWCGFFLNYDVTMWLRDLSDAEKTALWQAGWVVWCDAYGQDWWIEWIPSKLFFVGEYSYDMGRKETKWHWPKANRLIYDVGGFSQKSFVATLTDWKADLGISDLELAWLAEKKGERSTFSAEDQAEIEAYNQRECVWLARYVQLLDKTFQEEGVTLGAWHGGGALASWYLKANQVNEFVRDPVDSPGVMDAIMRAYFGGRNELMQMGRIEQLHDYDINSAYPWACTDIPDLVHGSWHHTRHYTDEPYALWHLKWDLRGHDQIHVMPFPVRERGLVHYPDVGEGWYHACEVDMAVFALIRAGVLGEQDGGPITFTVRGSVPAIEILEGWVYTPEDYEARPLAFVKDLAAARVKYKASDPKRAVPYKYALNSLYGKFAQHAAEKDQTPRWQSYYAAGYVTARTRARLLEFIWQKEHDDSDVVMLATDGVFCSEERTDGVGSGLGEYEDAGSLSEVYLVQPGVWYSPRGVHRTRGFGARSVDYLQVELEWRRCGPFGVIPYRETRFVGLGACAGWGDFSQYGCWVESERELVFYPARKFITDRLDAFDAGREQWRDSYRLSPPSLPDFLSEPYVPAPPNDSTLARVLWAEQAERIEQSDQPDGEGE